MEIIGTVELIQVEIQGSEWFIISDGNVRTRQAVTIDSEKKTVVIPVLTVLSDYFIYDCRSEGYVDLYVGEKMNIDISAALMGSMEGIKGMNSVSSDAVDILTDEMIKLFTKIPIIRMRRVQDAV